MIDTIGVKEQQIADDFHRLYYNFNFYGRPAWGDTFWMGVPVLKCPLDLWIYQEIIYKTRPDLIIETGTAHGGSALYMADILNVLGNGRVISIDNETRPRPSHPRIEYILADSTSDDIALDIFKFSHENKPSKIMVVLDSNHKKEHVDKELRIYSRMVTPGCYLIVEDTNVNGHPVGADHGPGPWEAVAEFMAGNKDFAVDKSMEKFYLTFNPFGYLIKVR